MTSSSPRHADPDENPYVEAPPTDFEPVGRSPKTKPQSRRRCSGRRSASTTTGTTWRPTPDSRRDVRPAVHAVARTGERVRPPDPELPTRRVGGEPLDELATVEHVAPMRSIDNATEADAVREFDGRVRKGSTPRVRLGRGRVRLRAEVRRPLRRGDLRGRRIRSRRHSWRRDRRRRRDRAGPDHPICPREASG